MTRGWLFIFMASTACAAAPRPPLAVSAVDGNPQHQALGKIVGVAELGDALVVFSDEGVTVLRGGAVAARESGRAWQSAPAVIPAADHAGRWVAAVDVDGRVQRIAALTSVEDVSARYRLEDSKTVALAKTGANSVAFAGADGLAIADGEHVTRFPGVHFTALAGGAGKLAGIAPGDQVQIWDLAHGQVRTFHVPGAHLVAIDSAGHAVVAARNDVYVDSGAGMERKLHAPAPIEGLVASGKQIWASAGSDLFVLENGVVSRTSGSSLPPGVKHLATAAAGGVWVFSGAQLTHVAIIDGTASPDLAWQSDIQPIFGRICSRCHLPGGSADVDLSTAHAWTTHRDLIRQRVLVEHDMPPAGTNLPPADRDAIARWVTKP